MCTLLYLLKQLPRLCWGWWWVVGEDVEVSIWLACRTLFLMVTNTDSLPISLKKLNLANIRWYLQYPKESVQSEPVQFNLLFVKRFKAFSHFLDVLEFPIYLLSFLWLQGTPKIFLKCHEVWSSIHTLLKVQCLNLQRCEVHKTV